MTGEADDMPDEATIARFWRRVAKGADDECWPWMGTKISQGYGSFSTNGKKVRAHRFSLSLSLGRPIRDGMFALHSCDNRPCVNPRHLREGTHIENMDDAAKRNRFHRWDGSRRCARNYNAKLNEGQVREIRKLGHLGRKQVARMYGVSKSTVVAIMTNYGWKNLT